MPPPWAVGDELELPPPPPQEYKKTNEIKIERKNRIFVLFLILLIKLKDVSE